MFAGACSGVDGTGSADCVHTGWSPHWLLTQAVVDFIDGLASAVLPPGDEVLCPWCYVQRLDDAGIPGFGPPKLAAILELLADTTCADVDGSRDTQHVHVYDLDAEVTKVTRRERNDPSPGAFRYRVYDSGPGNQPRPPGTGPGA